MSKNPKHDHAPDMPVERGGRPVRPAPNAPPVGTPVPAQVMLWYQPMPYVMAPAVAAVRPRPGGAVRPDVQDAIRVAAEKRESRIADWKRAVEALRTVTLDLGLDAGNLDAVMNGLLEAMLAVADTLFFEDGSDLGAEVAS